MCQPISDTTVSNQDRAAFAYEETVVNLGWRDNSPAMVTDDVLEDLLSEVIGAPRAIHVLEMLNPVRRVYYNPADDDAFSRMLTSPLEGIVHFFQSGPGTAIVPSVTEVFTLGPGVDDPALFHRELEGLPDRYAPDPLLDCARAVP